MHCVPRFPATIAAIAAVLAMAGPAVAKTCKAEVSARGLSTVSGSDARRASTAKSSALAKWRSQANAKYGLAYRFWSRADGKKIDCHKGKQVTRCTVSAKPCRLL